MIMCARAQQQRLQRAGNGDVDREQARIAVLDHLRIITEPTAAVSATEDPEMPEQVEARIDQRHPAANEAYEDLGQVDQALRHATDGHDRAGEDEEWDRQERSRSSRPRP